MKLNELSPNEGSVKNRKRVGRGIGSGTGKTCGRGQKGQKSRTGVAIKGFEGGQMPIDRRMPKMGFTNNFRTHYSTISLGRLQDAIDNKQIDAKKPIDEAVLVESKVVRRKQDGIKLLSNGELKAKVTLTLSAASKTAQEAVEKAGGSISFIEKKTAGPAKKADKK